MAQVFISYSSKELTQAQALRGVLEQNQISCWMAPTDIPGGSNYTKEIPLAIKDCQIFLLMLSSNAQQSHWVLKELENAVSKGKIILPFQLEDVSLTDEFNFLLSGAQRYDAYQKKMEATKSLVQRIKAILNADESGFIEGTSESEEEELEEKGFQEKEEGNGRFVYGLCPSCGSSKIKNFGDAVRPHLPGEYRLCATLSVIFGLLLAVGIVVVCLLFGELLGMIDPDLLEFMSGVAVVGLLPAAVYGGIVGNRIAKRRIRIKRLQSRTAVTEHQCQTCRKRFQLPLTDIK